jgi:hypothetical protein
VLCRAVLSARLKQHQQSHVVFEVVVAEADLLQDLNEFEICVLVQGKERGLE